MTYEHLKPVLNALLHEASRQLEWGECAGLENVLRALKKEHSAIFRYRDAHSCALEFRPANADDEGFWITSDRFVVSGYLASDGCLQSIVLDLFESDTVTLDVGQMSANDLIGRLVQAEAIERIEIE
jgi:hypothetical protein